MKVFKAQVDFFTLSRMETGNINIGILTYRRLIANADKTYDETEPGISLEENNDGITKFRKKGCCKS